MTDTPTQPKHTFPKAPGAPGWKEKPKAGGAFAVAVLAAGIAAALLPSEARKLRPYQDSAKIWTICMGIIDPKIVWRHKGTDFTVEECKAAEADYIAPMVKAMHRCLPADIVANTTYGEWISYGHWSFNTGTWAFCNPNSTLHKHLASGNRVGACRAMGAWTFITLNGKKRNCRDADMKRVCNGIVIRRDLEVGMCLDAQPD